MADRLQLNDPQTLYRRWEDSNRSPFEIDLRRDAEQWREMARDQRELVHFVFSSPTPELLPPTRSLHGQMNAPSGPPAGENNALASVVLVGEDDDYRIAAFHDTLVASG